MSVTRNMVCRSRMWFSVSEMGSGCVEAGIEPAAYAVEQGEAQGAVQVLHLERGFGQMAFGQQGGAHDAGQEAGAEGWGVPARLALFIGQQEGHIADGRFRQFARLVPQQSVE